MSGRGIWKKRREKKSQVDVIDRGGDFCVCVCLSAVGAVMCERLCLCVNVCVLYLFASTSQRLCGHSHIVFSVVSKRGLELNNVSKIFDCRMAKCFL